MLWALVAAVATALAAAAPVDIITFAASPLAPEPAAVSGPPPDSHKAAYDAFKAYWEKDPTADMKPLMKKWFPLMSETQIKVLSDNWAAYVKMRGWMFYPFGWLNAPTSGGAAAAATQAYVTKILFSLGINIMDFGTAAQQTFINKLAQAMGIDPSRITILSAVAGSVKVTTQVAEEPGKKSAKDAAETVSGMTLAALSEALGVTVESAPQVTYEPIVQPSPSPSPAPASTNSAATSSSQTSVSLTGRLTESYSSRWQKAAARYADKYKAVENSRALALTMFNKRMASMQAAHLQAK